MFLYFVGAGGVAGGGSLFVLPDGRKGGQTRLSLFVMPDGRKGARMFSISKIRRESVEFENLRIKHILKLTKGVVVRVLTVTIYD